MKDPPAKGDRAGILIAVACFVHCVAGPIVLSFAGLASIIGISEKLEPLLLFSSLGTGVMTLIPAYRKKHRRLSCLVLFATGVVCLAMRKRVPMTGVLAEPIFVGIGAVMIVGAHVLNLRLSKRCQCCGLPEICSKR